MSDMSDLSDVSDTSEALVVAGALQRDRPHNV